MAETPLAVIIILNWNNWRDTIACVGSCRGLTWPNFRMVIVDNGSTDGSEIMIRQGCPDAELLQTGKNLGYAGGINAGIRHAMTQGAEYVWLLNNDTMVDPDALSRLVETMEDHREAAFAGSKIYYHDDPERIWFAGGIWDGNGLRVRQRGAGEKDTGQYETMGTIGSVSGCSMIARVSALERIGLMDEGFFLYWEDTDWCARGLEQGYAVLFVPSSSVWHRVSSTVAQRSALQNYYNTRNGLIFCKRHDPSLMGVFLSHVVAAALSGLLHGNSEMLRGLLKGVADFFRGKTGRAGEGIL